MKVYLEHHVHEYSASFGFLNTDSLQDIFTIPWLGGLLRCATRR